MTLVAIVVVVVKVNAPELIKTVRKRERKKRIVAKASDGHWYPLPLTCLVVCDGERGSGPEGADDLGF